MRVLRSETKIKVMFKRLISNLPYNPSLIGQVSFYTQRVKQERLVRRIGFSFMSLTLLINTFIFITPPERSLATSSSHILNGARTRDDILNAWDQPGSDLPAIYGRFGVTRDDIQSLPEKPNSAVTSTAADYWTIGRTSLKNYSGVKEAYKNSQLSIQYDGRETDDSSDDQFVYQRELRAWDINNSTNTYPAFKGTIKKTGETFWLLKDCGNLTKIGKTKPQEPKDPKTPVQPELEIVKSIENQAEFYKPGDKVTFRISYRNKTPDTLAENVSLQDQIDTKYFTIGNVETDEYRIFNGFYQRDEGGLAYTPQFKTITLQAQLKNPIGSGTQICNEARIVSSNTSAKTSNKVCLGILVPCPFDASVGDANNPNCTAPKVVCKVVDTAFNRSTKSATLKTTVTSSNERNTTIKGYTYKYGDDSEQELDDSGFSSETTHTFGAGKHTTEVAVHYRTTGQTDDEDQTATCLTELNFDEDQPLGQSKEVANKTQNTSGELAQKTTVQPGDVLEYTITTTNTEGHDRTGVTISDYIGDILDYASLDTEKLAASGGAYEPATNKVVWNNQTIPGGKALARTFTVSIKNPIPTTNKPSGANGTFDCVITNEYGNEVSINVNCPLVKGIEKLPNTGPGSGMMMIGGISLLVGYFFARSRLLARELDIIRADYNGGMV